MLCCRKLGKPKPLPDLSNGVHRPACRAIISVGGAADFQVGGLNLPHVRSRTRFRRAQFGVHWTDIDPVSDTAGTTPGSLQRLAQGVVRSVTNTSGSNRRARCSLAETTASRDHTGQTSAESPASGDEQRDGINLITTGFMVKVKFS